MATPPGQLPLAWSGQLPGLQPTEASRGRAGSPGLAWPEHCGGPTSWNPTGHAVALMGPMIR